jgi:hypothetical protein
MSLQTIKKTVDPHQHVHRRDDRRGTDRRDDLQAGPAAVAPVLPAK